MRKTSGFKVAARGSAICLLLLTATSTNAAKYEEVFSEAEAAIDTAANPFLETVIIDGGTAYAALREGVTLSEVTAFDGVSFSPVMSAAQWSVVSSSSYAAGNGGRAVGGQLRAVNFFTNSIYEVDLSTGVPAEVVSKATIDGVVGVSASLVAFHETASDGTIYAVESTSDQIIAVSPANAVSIEINSADLATLAGGTSIGGIGVLGTDIYIGSNSNDTLSIWDTIGNASTVVLTTAQIESVTDSINGVVSFGDIYAAPDGLIYFYEGDSDYLLSFDPADPAGTIAAVISEADFNAGPGSDTINQLAYYKGAIAWTDSGLGFYRLIPEPSSAFLAVLGASVLIVAARQR